MFSHLPCIKLLALPWFFSLVKIKSLSDFFKLTNFSFLLRENAVLFLKTKWTNNQIPAFNKPLHLMITLNSKPKYNVCVQNVLKQDSWHGELVLVAAMFIAPVFMRICWSSGTGFFVNVFRTKLWSLLFQVFLQWLEIF